MPLPETRRPELAAGILIGGAIAHALLCGPAIGCRGYPSLDPIWYGITFIWPVAVVISAYFDSMRYGVRRYQLLIYAFATAFLTAGTVVTIVPRRIELDDMLAGTVVIGPIHLLVTFVLEFIVQRIYSIRRHLVDRGAEEFRVSFSSRLLVFTWTGLVLGIPYGYQALVESSVKSRAIQRADNDWETNALVYRDIVFNASDGCIVRYEFDPETGLELRRRTSDLGFADRYNARIDELIRLHGIPEYSIKTIIPKPDKVIELLDSIEMDPVDTFPVDLTENIHLMRRGSVTRWGSTSTSGSDSLSIVTPRAHIGAGDGILPVHSTITDHIIYIRNGPNWIGAFLPDGRLVMSVLRFP